LFSVFHNAHSGPCPRLWLVLSLAILWLLTSVAASRAATLPTLIFQGNEALSEAELRVAAAEELAEMERSGPRKDLADDAAFQMELACRQAGFAFATMNYQYETDLAQEAVRITFSLEEGPRVTVSRLEFTGQPVYDHARLRAFFPNAPAGLLGPSGKFFYAESTIRESLAALRNYYISQGYLEIAIADPALAFTEDRSHVDITVEVEAGPRHLIQEVRFSGNMLDQVSTELTTVADDFRGLPYFSRRQLLIKSRIQELYGNAGYPDALIRIDELQGEQPGDTILTATIESGPQVTIDRLEIVGNNRTQEEFIANRLHLQPGDTYTAAAKRDSFQDLYRTGLFSRVDLKLLGQTGSDNRGLGVTVEETPAREVSVEAGWGSYELLRFILGIRDRNFRGSGRIVRTEGAFSFKGKSIECGLTDPWFLGTDIVADLPVFFRSREEPSFTRQETGTSFLLSERIREHLSASLGYAIRLTRITNLGVNISQEAPETGYNIASITAQATLDTRDDIFFPTTGYRLFMAIEIADEFLGSEIAFNRLTAGGRYFRLLSPALTLGLRYNTGIIVPGRQQTTIPVGERFFNGGENTVRSFEESRLGPMDLNDQPVGGMAYNVASFELRRRLSERFAMTLFFDYGNISPNHSRDEEGRPAFADRDELIHTTLKEYLRDFRPGIGLGLQYLLPFGPARLDFALNPAQRQEAGEERYAVHFSIGMAF